MESMHGTRSKNDKIRNITFKIVWLANNFAISLSIKRLCGNQRNNPQITAFVVPRKIPLKKRTGQRKQIKRGQNKTIKIYMNLCAHTPYSSYLTRVVELFLDLMSHIALIERVTECRILFYYMVIR